MMTENSESKMILEIWEITREYIPEKKRNEYLFSFFNLLEDYNIFVEDLPDLKGEDKNIDAALTDYLGSLDADDLDEEPEDE